MILTHGLSAIQLMGIRYSDGELEFLFGTLTHSPIWRGDLHGIGGHMSSVRTSVFTGAGEGNTLLVASKLDEFTELLLREHFERGPEELNVLVGLHQSYLVHSVSLDEREEENRFGE